MALLSSGQKEEVKAEFMQSQSEAGISMPVKGDIDDVVDALDSAINSFETVEGTVDTINEVLSGVAAAANFNSNQKAMLCYLVNKKRWEVS